MTELPARLVAAVADRYRLERELGAGGMATVYLGYEHRNRRQVALKVLRPEVAATLGKDRFTLEIEVLAHLRHPHILPLLDSGEADGYLYYVMPLVEGESLRTRLERQKQLPLDEAIHIAREIADALGFAHGRGIVHRDIKPENILLDAGHAVVADFGIARAVSEAGGNRLTESGIVVGTPPYMSPEQAAGTRDLDGRSDLYALGCVLYETLAGKPPFTGPTVESVVRQHLTAPVPPLRQLRPTVPAAVDALVQRSLAKAPADRFQSAEQVVAALTAAVTPPAGTARATRWNSARVGALLGAAAVLGAMGIAITRWLGATGDTLTTANAIPVTSEPGIEYQPALSPDGNLVAYVSNHSGRLLLTVRGTRSAAGTGESRPAETVPGDQALPAWSSDGQLVRFTTGVNQNQTTFGLSWSEVGPLGGAARPVQLPRASRWISWAPRGDVMAFAVGDTIFAHAAGTDSTWIVATTRGLHPQDPRSLAISPDGRWIAYVDGPEFWVFRPNTFNSAIWMVATAGGIPVPITGKESLNESPAWLAPGQLLFVSNRDGPREVYLTSVGAEGPRGTPRKVPGGTDAHSISVSRDGKRLAVARMIVRQNVQAYPLRSSVPTPVRSGRPITSGTQAVELHDVSPDGKWLAYDSNLRGNADIYKIPVDGGEPTPLVTGPLDEFSPAWSPDGTEIAYEGVVGHGANQRSNLFVVPSAGGAPTRLTPGFRQIGNPHWGPTGQDLVFWGAPDTSKLGLWIIHRDRPGGAWGVPRPLTTYFAIPLTWARDGRGVFCLSLIKPHQLVLISPSGSEVWRRDLPGTLAERAVFPKPSPDGDLFYATEGPGGSKGLWAWPVAGGSPKPLVALDDPSLSLLGYVGAVSIHGNELYLTVTEVESDIWVMDLVR